MRANPGGLLSPDEVVGRDELIARLWRILERQSLILTSERRMGKTSIIRKMAAASPSGQLAIYRDLEPLSTPLEFVQIVVDDVRRYLNRSQRTVRRVLEFLEQFGGTEVSGVIKLPDTVATNWQTLLMRTIEDLVEHQDRTLIFLWDEMPMMLDKIKQSNGENEAMEVLNTLRYLRQTHPSVRMVYTGSIGLHHVLTSLRRVGYASAPTNDMYTIDVPPLSSSDARTLAQRLLEGEAMMDELTQMADTIAEAVDGCPYYIHHIVEAMTACSSKLTTDDVAQLVASYLTATNDPWDLRHYRDRINIYYPETERRFVLSLLDILAIADEPLIFDELFNRLKAHVPTEAHETIRDVLRRLQDDHYIDRRWDGRYYFRFGIIQQWWRLERGLP